MEENKTGTEQAAGTRLSTRIFEDAQEGGWYCAIDVVTFNPSKEIQLWDINCENAEWYHGRNEKLQGMYFLTDYVLENLRIMFESYSDVDEAKKVIRKWVNKCFVAHYDYYTDLGLGVGLMNVLCEYLDH